MADIDWEQVKRDDLEWDAIKELELEERVTEHDSHATPDPDCPLCDDDERKPVSVAEGSGSWYPEPGVRYVAPAAYQGPVAIETPDGEEYADETARQNGPIVIGQRCPWCGALVDGPNHTRSHD